MVNCHEFAYTVVGDWPLRLTLVLSKVAVWTGEPQ